MIEVLEKTWLQEKISKGSNCVFAEMVSITPELAMEFLERNPDNRSVNRFRVEAYASDMVNGVWAANGEPIIISDDGQLNDGQHRLHAIIKAGIPVESLVVFGVDRSTRTTTNQGKSKSVGDYAGMEGTPNANNIGAMSRLCVAYYDKKTFVPGTISNAITLKYLRENIDELSASFVFVQGYYKSSYKQLIAPSVIAFCHYAFSKINKEDANNYITQVMIGANLNPGDPALIVRNRLLGLGKLRSAKIEAVFHGWNAYRRGETRSIIQIKGGYVKLI